MEIEGIVTGYGKKQVVNGVSAHIRVGEIVAIIGHNGAGKSTLLKAVFGLVPLWQGQVAVDGKQVRLPEPRFMLGAGVAYVPQGNRIFPDLSVRENLEMGAILISDRARVANALDDTLHRFPSLEPLLRRQCGQLSGGQKQMVALATALMTAPRLLLLDEPSLGLAPSLVSAALSEVRDQATACGRSALIVEQKVREVLRVADRVYVLRNGRISYQGQASDLHDEDRLREVYL